LTLPETAGEGPAADIQSRRTDRVAINLPIQVSGLDVNGMAFTEKTRTLVVSRHGAAIPLKRMLVTGQELKLLCGPTGKETRVRVVDQAGTGAEGYHYGVEILDPEVDLWELVFPPLSEANQAAARILLECERCHVRELTYVNEFDLEIFQAHGALSRMCKGCANTTIWKQCTAGSTLDLGPPPVLTAPVRTRNERSEYRISIHTEACIRHPQQGQEIVKTLNASRSGFCFKSSKTYEPGIVVEAAVPYTRGVGNVFTAAKIEHAEPLGNQGDFIYGASYIRDSKDLRGNLDRERTPY
jgi:hypothetical protein